MNDDPVWASELERLRTDENLWALRARDLLLDHKEKEATVAARRSSEYGRAVERHMDSKKEFRKQ